MISSKSAHAKDSGRLFVRAIALVQLVAMVMLAVPAFSYDFAQDRMKEEICQSAHTNDSEQGNGQNHCPCCPGDDQSEGDACSTCSNCAFFTPLVSAPSIAYVPSVAQLELFENFTKLCAVHIPIFVPPQNLA